MLRALGSHVIDLMRFLTMGEVTSVSAHMQCTNIHLPDEHGAAVQVCAVHCVVLCGYGVCLVQCTV